MEKNSPERSTLRNQRTSACTKSRQTLVLEMIENVIFKNLFREKQSEVNERIIFNHFNLLPINTRFVWNFVRGSRSYSWWFTADKSRLR